MPALRIKRTGLETGHNKNLLLSRDVTNLSLFEGSGHRAAEVGRCFYSLNAGGVHGGVLVLGRALAAGDDGASVAHAAPWRGSLTSDESNDRFFHVGFDPLGCGFFGVTPDFADEDDCVRISVIAEKLDGFEKRGADDRITADTDTGGLADAEASELVHGFVGQGPTAADYTNVALLV